MHYNLRFKAFATEIIIDVYGLRKDAASRISELSTFREWYSLQHRR